MSIRYLNSQDRYPADIAGDRPSVKNWGVKGDYFQSYFLWATTKDSPVVGWPVAQFAGKVFTTPLGAPIAPGATVTIGIAIGVGVRSQLWINPNQPNQEVVSIIDYIDIGGATPQVTCKFKNAHVSGEAIADVLFVESDAGSGKMAGVSGAGAVTASQWMTEGINPTGYATAPATNALTVIDTFATTQLGIGFDPATGLSQPTAGLRYELTANGAPILWGWFGSNDPTFATETQVFDASGAYGTAGLATLGDRGVSYANRAVIVLTNLIYQHYRLKVQSLTPGVAAGIVGCAVTHGNCLSGAIVGYIDPLTCVIDTPASYTTNNAWGFLGTDDTAALQNAIYQCYASLNTGGAATQGAPELYVPAGNYMLTGSIWVDGVRLVGSHSSGANFYWAPGLTSLSNLTTLQGFTVQPFVMLGHSATFLGTFGPPWSGDYPSFGCTLENINLYMNELPGLGVYCETGQELTGLFRSQANAYTAMTVHPNGSTTWCDYPVRGMLLASFAAQNFSWHGLSTACGYSNTPHPQLNTTAAIAAGTAVTVTVNRTDFLTVGMALDIDHFLPTYEAFVITALTSTAITGTFAHAHASGAVLIISDQPAGFEIFGCPSRVAMRDLTTIPAQPGAFGWGVGVKVTGCHVSIAEVHCEGGLYAFLALSGAIVHVDTLQALGPLCLASTYSGGPCLITSLSRQDYGILFYDGISNTFETGFFSVFRSVSPSAQTFDVYGQGFIDFCQGMLNVTYTGVRMKSLYFGVTSIPQPAFIPPQLLIGNQVTNAWFALAHDGVNNDFMSFLASFDYGATWRHVLSIDNYFGGIISPFLEFGDGMVVIASSFVLPPLGFGHHVSSGWWQWLHTGFSGDILALQASSTAGSPGGWTTVLAFDAVSLVASFNDIASAQFAAPGSLLFSESVGGALVIREGAEADLVGAMFRSGGLVNNEPIVWTGTAFACIAAASAALYPAVGVIPKWLGSAWGAATASDVTTLLGIPAGDVVAFLVPFPAHFNSAGGAGQIASDPSGNFYFWSVQWYRIGPAGFSSTF